MTFSDYVEWWLTVLGVLAGVGGIVAVVVYGSFHPWLFIPFGVVLVPWVIGAMIKGDD